MAAITVIKQYMLCLDGGSKLELVNFTGEDDDTYVSKLVSPRFATLMPTDGTTPGGTSLSGRTVTIVRSTEFITPATLLIFGT